MASLTESSTGQSAGGTPFDRLLPKRSAGLKLILVCALALLMAIPAMFVYGVVHERTSGAAYALTEISEKAGGPQAFLGPVLAVPFVRTPDPETPENQFYGHAIAFAETGRVVASVQVEERKRGIYHIPVFDAELAVEARFDPMALRTAIPTGAKPIWADARLYTGVSDTRGLRSSVTLLRDGDPLILEPAGGGRYGTETTFSEYRIAPNSELRLSAAGLPDLETASEPINISLDLRLTGAQRLSFAAFAKDTEVDLSSNWSTPSFTGGVLPLNHTADDSQTDGFEAQWAVPYLARSLPGAGARISLNDLFAQGTPDMAVAFMKPANPYQSVERALKYALMFIGFVFLAYFLFEITQQTRAHPAQYVLLGLAQSIFYLLLLAFAERMGFDLAFGLAAAMTIGLISLYTVSVFASRKTGIAALAVLAGLYGLIYILMRAQDIALLAGALACFVAIGVTMFMTRNVDWYGERAAR